MATSKIAKMEIRTNAFQWIKLLLSASIPLMIGIFTVITSIQQQNFSFLQREQDRQAALLLRQQSEQQADNLHKEKVYATYLDDVSKLWTIDNEKGALIKIRAKTLASLRQLDTEHKTQLFLFLYDSELIYFSPLKSISSLLKVNGANFNGIYLRGTPEATCSFIYLYMHSAYLSNVSLIDCFIDRSNFSSAVMYKTIFIKTRFLRTSFRFALLDRTDFSHASFFQMDFVGASLVDCNFTDVFWRNEAVDFTGANLTGAIISDQQLRISILYNSILPNGTWGSAQRKNLVINGDAEQNDNISHNTNLTGWHVSVPDILNSLAYDNRNITAQFGKHHFRVKPSYILKHSISMSQNISFENFILLISADLAHYNASVNLQCSGNQYGYIELIFFDMNGVRYVNFIYRDNRNNTQLKYLTVSGMLDNEVRSMQLKIGLVKDLNYTSSNTTMEENYCIVDNIEFFIMKAK